MEALKKKSIFFMLQKFVKTITEKGDINSGHKAVKQPIHVTVVAFLPAFTQIQL